jgi:hypothetical protein
MTADTSDKAGLGKVQYYSGRDTAIWAFDKTCLPGNAVSGRDSGADGKFIDIGKRSISLNNGEAIY